MKLPMPPALPADLSGVPRAELETIARALYVGACTAVRGLNDLQEQLGKSEARYDALRARVDALLGGDERS